MSKFLWTLLFSILSAGYCSADTTYYENGKIQAIYDHQRSFTEFYMNGSIMKYIEFDKFWRKGKQLNYDSTGQVISKGKIIFNGRKHGVWKDYSNGKVIQKTRYKFGVDKKFMRTPSGKRARIYLTYGYAPFRGPCDSAQNKFKVKFLPVAGCVVSRKLLFRSSWHNFFVNVQLMPRFGLNWQDKVHEFCTKR
jgi:hypothetical protein